MKAQARVACLILLGQASLFNEAEAAMGRGLGSTGSAQFSRPASLAAGGPSQTEPGTPGGKCLEAGERVRRDVAAMVPGRTWTWQLDSERSRKQVEVLRRDLRDFWDAEAAFDASLTADQKSKVNSQFILIRELFHHLEGDAESLSAELQKGYPTRWHVEHDVSDMQKEISQWRKLHRRIARDLGSST